MNENYFSDQSIESCYWSGFIAADGNIRDTQKTGQNKLRVTLAETDLDHLKKLHKSLGLTNKLSYSAPRNYANTKFICKAQYRLETSSDKICNDLRNLYNITPRKTNTLLPPNITDDVRLKAFLIGVIDADGSIHFDKNHNYFVLQIKGNSEIFLTWCKKKLAEISNIKETPKLYTTKSNSSFNVYYSARKAREIFKALKDVDVPRLQRKWGKVI